MPGYSSTWPANHNCEGQTHLHRIRSGDVLLEDAVAEGSWTAPLRQHLLAPVGLAAQRQHGSPPMQACQLPLPLRLSSMAVRYRNLSSQPALTSHPAGPQKDCCCAGLDRAGRSGLAVDAIRQAGHDQCGKTAVTLNMHLIFILLTPDSRENRVHCS